MKKSKKIILLANVFMKNLNDVDEDLIDQLLVQEGFNINELNQTIDIQKNILLKKLKDER